MSASLIAEVIIIPFSGWLAKLLSTRVLFLISISGFVSASLGCALSTNYFSMVLFRGFQGFFGGAMLPISAFLSSKEVMNHFNAGSHGSTFGGNPLATKVASRALQLLYEDNLIENSAVLGEYFKSRLQSIDNKIIKDVRGKGLWIGMELNESEVNAKDLCLMLLNEGLLCKETHKTVIRFAPPLMISKDDLDWAIKKITKVIRAT